VRTRIKTLWYKIYIRGRAPARPADENYLDNEDKLFLRRQKPYQYLNEMYHMKNLTCEVHVEESCYIIDLAVIIHLSKKTRLHGNR
jgi:hypothetical protein